MEYFVHLKYFCSILPSSDILLGIFYQHILNCTHTLGGYNCSVSRWRPQKVDKRMVLEHTHGLFIT
jgi:hypothetical protein